MLPGRVERPARRMFSRVRSFAARQSGGLRSVELRDEQPLRGDLYSVDQLAQHARTLASWHQAIEQPDHPEPLLRRLQDNHRVLEQAYKAVVRAGESGRRITPAAEWIIDNFYLIEEQFRLATRHLPRGYARELPRLTNGSSAGRPRVYDLALELISHVDGQIDEVALTRFIEAYQTMAPLKLGELWAVPIMLRIALLENLRRVAARVEAGQLDQDRATAWSKRILHAAKRDPKSVVRVLADLYDGLETSPASPRFPADESTIHLSSAFVSEFARRLQGQGHGTAFPLEWLTQALAEQGSGIEAMASVESQRQAADQVSIGNAIGSLRFIESHDWLDWVEAMSVVERVLRSDPADAYVQQDFDTRDRYRHAVESIAKRSELTEEQVAELSVKLARDADQRERIDGGSGKITRESHIGHHLIGPGRRHLERAAGARAGVSQFLRRLAKAAPLTWYVGGTLLTSLGLCAAVLWWSDRTGWSLWMQLLISGPLLIAASQVGVSLGNWFVNAFVAPRPLGRFDYSEGIPPSSQTIVVVPAMLTSAERADELVEGLELRHLSNPDENLRFALLTDLPDAGTETASADADTIGQCEKSIHELNRRYGYGTGEKFMLLHRPRRFNEADGVWMGWERKRGKLTEFNRLLRPCDDDDSPAKAFSTVVARRELLFAIKYVITLDSDTALPRGAARLMVGTMDHPLNKPVWDEKRRRVTEGYGILQPRVGIDLPSARASFYSRLGSGEPGIDPYTRAVSDVYQDAFNEGSFIGKGIYAADIFEQACGDRFAENTILSHDLIESAFARSALVSDVVLYEDAPASYLADIRRRHRWIRGDWQIAGYLLSTSRDRLSPLAKWKIFDNLRRSLVAPAVVATLLLAWLVKPEAALAWCGLALAYFFAPPLLTFVVGLVRTIGKTELPLRLVLRDHFRSLVAALGRSSLFLAFLPYEAWQNLDAIVRTVWRTSVSRRRLLEWQTADAAATRTPGDLRGHGEAMWPAWMLAIAVFAWFVGLRLGLVSLGPMAFSLIWGASPLVSWGISRVERRRRIDEKLTASDRRFLRKLSRRTWSYFERFVVAAEHFLPPDNYQEPPAEQVASRTSPTNMGLALLSNLAAHDFGYVTLGQLLDRTERTLGSMDRLERHESGHFFNWYDTQTLSPLNPRYVSAVDSGNLIACMHVLKAGLLELSDRPAVDRQGFRGIADVIRLLLDTCRGKEHVSMPGDQGHAAERVSLPDHLQRRLEALANECDERSPAKLSGAKLVLQKLSIAASESVAAVAPSSAVEAKRWAGEFDRQVSRFAEELHHLCPWVDLVGPARPYQAIDPSSRARLRQIDQAINELEGYPTLRQVAHLTVEVVPIVEEVIAEVEHATLRPHADLPYFRQVHRVLTDAAARSKHRILTLDRLAELTASLLECDWGVVYDDRRDLLHIGYNAQERRLDAGYYDLLASEMRLGSFMLVATGVLPQEHWFRLGRQITTSGSYAALLSWSGSIFEYLMPLLVMPTYDGTLLDETYKGVVNRQIEYARGNGIRSGVPWGVSESGYSAVDAGLTYQYRPFGVPGLGYKRGLGEDLVVAPYASVMAAMVDPVASVTNLRRLRDEGKLGQYGFFEAIDYTPARIKRGKSEAVVRQFMVHHQGMSFLAMAYVLLDQPMQRRLMAQPAFKSAAMLLHERIPKVAPVYPHTGEHAGSKRAEQQAVGTLRVFNTPNTPTPEVHLLSNGRLTVMITAAGGGYTRWDTGEGKVLAVTRWQEDAVRDCWGSFVYIRDRETGEFWSNTYQPTRRRPARYEAIFSQARAEFRRVDRSEPGNESPSSGVFGPTDEIATDTQVSVSPEDDVEVRRITLTNNGKKSRTLELTSYAESVLADPRADAAHPAFQNLFVQTRLVKGRQAILAKRRARSAGERTPYIVHLMTCYGTEVGKAQYETDRNAFIGRGRTLADPAAMHGEQLANSSGSVLDPIVSVRRTVRLEPGEKVMLDIVTGVADTHEAAHGLIEKYHDRRLNDRVTELAWTHSQIVLRQLGIDEADAQVYGRLASSIVYATPQRRAPAEIIARNQTLQRKQSNLWAHGISGDWPIVLVRVSDLSRIKVVEEAVRAHAYWRRKGLRCDLIIQNEDTSGYRAEMHEAILSAIGKAGETSLIDQNTGIFVRRSEQFSEEDRILMQALARVTLSDKAGTLAEQVDRRMNIEPQVPKFAPSQPRAGLLSRREPETAAELPEVEMLFRNGIGGFTPDGKEYIILTTAETPTPAPWSNVMANPQFGTIVTESGGGYTWRTNAREFRLTPFYNDPVSDTSGEAIYLRDEETGRLWSPTPLPVRGSMPYVTRHGFGYSVYEYAEAGLRTKTTIFVHRSEPVKFWTITVTNQTDRPRRISLSAYCEWVLSDQRAAGAMHIVTSVEPRTGAVFAQNPYNAEFGQNVGFLACSETTRSVTGDRLEFIGRNRSAANPAAMGRTRLSGKVGAGLDPCGAVRTPIDLGPGEEREIVFILGAGDNEAHAQSLCSRFTNAAAARAALKENWDFWGDTLGSLYIETPDPAMNVLVNGWLEYQVLSCRYWGRSGYYQSGGAYGFRDQLQDVASLLWCDPSAIREHLLRASRHQFKEGDVLHWWHPPRGQGVRTHFSDDYLWLPLIAARYVSATGDTGVLGERTPFLEGPPVPHDQESIYQEFPAAQEDGTLYEHCKRSILNAIDRRGYGSRGLPLIGCGDWNDGMNLIGEHGKGESVWLAWFLTQTLLDFAPIADDQDDPDFAARCRNEADRVCRNAEMNAWDGEWYRRAYFDNGEPLGSSTNEECQIDSLPQSWAILCGRANAERAASGMRCVDERLVRREKRIIQLFDPPFDTSDLDPGYIKGYAPGVRENGGQYTHAAIWVVMAYAQMGDARRAWELFNLINPVNHTSSAEGVAVYKVEPYVVAADVYGVDPHIGRGGWTWYTGSAGWMLRLAVESLLGLRLAFEEGESRLYVQPLLPDDWKGFTFNYRHRGTHHRIVVQSLGGGVTVRSITIDGQNVKEKYIRLFNDRQRHDIEIVVGGDE